MNRLKEHDFNRIKIDIVVENNEKLLLLFSIYLKGDYLSLDHMRRKAEIVTFPQKAIAAPSIVKIDKQPHLKNEQFNLEKCFLMQIWKIIVAGLELARVPSTRKILDSNVWHLLILAILLHNVVLHP